ncbi:MAG TPA: O-antigen ligase family protein [Bacteroidales bacterium]|nr:O-antigen ligase family protein [Bacteroidales bacterium]HPS16031.1 O-antigen ligase family protein [Bacteroidales bacterium]
MKNGIRFGNKELYFFSLCIIAAGLPLSKAGISIGEILLAISWLWGGNFRLRIQSFFKNKTALIISSLFLLHLLGLIYTSDFDYAFKDLRIKFPLLLLPFIISTSEQLDNKKFHALILVTIISAFISTLFSMYNYFTMQFSDIRDICVFVSHIRLSLLICFSVFSLLYFIFKTNHKRYIKILFALLVIWFVIFLIILESFTGLIILFICFLILLIIQVFRERRTFLKVGIVFIIILIPTILFFYINSFYKTYFTKPVIKEKHLELYTLSGNRYDHDTLSNDVENGYYVWIYICEPEIRKEWNKRSNYKYDETDKKGQGIKYTLRRFLTSKGLRKDSVGVSMLTDTEVNAVENGIADVNLLQLHSLESRIYETLWEIENYRETNDPNGHSLLQRYEYWKVSLLIIEKNYLIGVGTGDMNEAFEKQYEDMQTRLDEKWRLRSHNQFLSIAVGFGIIGFLWFLLVILFPIFIKKYRTNFFYLIFFLIIFISMFTEDTIESQIGLTLYAFFNSLLLFGRKFNDEVMNEKHNEILEKS